MNRYEVEMEYKVDGDVHDKVKVCVTAKTRRSAASAAKVLYPDYRTTAVVVLEEDIAAEDCYHYDKGICCRDGEPCNRVDACVENDHIHPIDKEAKAAAEYLMTHPAPPNNEGPHTELNRRTAEHLGERIRGGFAGGTPEELIFTQLQIAEQRGRVCANLAHKREMVKAGDPVAVGNQQGVAVPADDGAEQEALDKAGADGARHFESECAGQQHQLINKYTDQDRMAAAIMLLSSVPTGPSYAFANQCIVYIKRWQQAGVGRPGYERLEEIIYDLRDKGLLDTPA